MNTYNFSLSAVLLSVCLIIYGECTNLGESKYCPTCPRYGGFLTCDPVTCDWLLLNGNWVGNVTAEGELLVASCPSGYCVINETGRYVWIPQNITSRTLNDFICNSSHRMGILCGLCQPGYAPAINSDYSDCVSCDSKSSKVNWIYYILAVYAPLLVVFLIIIVFNIRLTTGPVNSFIIFAQVISTTVDISEQGSAPVNVVYGSGTRIFESTYVIPYNLFNLNLFGNLLPPFCLNESLNTLDIIALRYMEAFFPVFIIIGVVLLLRCNRYLKMNAKVPSCFQKYRVGGHLVQAFAAFILLSYNRLCEITAYLLTPSLAFDSTLQYVERVVYYQGDYSTQNSHYVARYKVPAYLMTALLTLVPISLLHFPMIWIEMIVSKIGWVRKWYPSASIAILLDTFQGCFKDNRRYFAGLYLMLRLMLFFAYFQPWQLQLLIQQILFIVYIFLLAFLKPYRENHLNYLDTAMFTNLALINGLSWYTVMANQTGPNQVALETCIIFESALVFLPMVYLVVYLLWRITKCYHEAIKTKVSKWYHSTKHLMGKVPREHLSTAHSIGDADFDDLIKRQDEWQYGAMRGNVV